MRSLLRLLRDFCGLACIFHTPRKMHTECRHLSGLAAKAFAPASRFPSGLRG
jgi:hypothetical protein